MKRNKMMRIAAVLLVVTLLSTVAISGTFAKYVTKASGEDAARVAKWGIVITAEDNLFSKTYVAHDGSYVGGEYTVESSNDDKVVAPGTSSRDIDDGGFVATIKGTPEVATRYTLKLTGLKDVFLPNGTYTDYTGEADTFAVAERPAAYVKGYSPVKWNFTVSKTGGRSVNLVDLAREVAADVAASAPGAAAVFNGMFTADGVSITDAKMIAKEMVNRGMIADFEDELQNRFRSLDGKISNLAVNINGEDIEVSLDFAPNVAVDYSFQLDWAWAFESGHDQADTYLGNIAAGVADIYVPADASTELGFNFTATATQID